MKMLQFVIAAVVYAQAPLPAPTKLPLTAIATKPTGIAGVFVLTETGQIVVARPGNAQLHINQQTDGSYTITADAVSITIAPKIVIGQVLPILNGVPQLASISMSITAPVIYRNGLRLSEHRDYELEPVLQVPLGAAPTKFNVRLLPGVTPVDPADTWICDYLA